MTDLLSRPATELVELVRRAEVSPVELVTECLDRIDRLDEPVNAFVTVCADEALDAARDAERAVHRGDPLGPLHGLPFAAKDLDAVAGIRTTRGSRLFADDVPGTTITPLRRLRDAGAIVVGKTNAPEFGHKAVTDNALVGPTSTPFAPGMNAGGSSGGSAAAVAAGMVPVAQGSDAGGSLRVPASFCGVFTMMPSFGRVPVAVRPNAFLLLNPMVCYGPLARSVADAALMLDVMAGPDPRDPFALPAAPPGATYSGAVGRDVRGLRVAWCPDLGGFPVEPQMVSLVRDGLRALEGAGAVVHEVDLRLPRPHEEITELWRRLQAVRQAEFVARMHAVGLDILGERAAEVAPEYLELGRTGAEPSAVAYRMEDDLRTELWDAFADVFDACDVIASPVTGIPGVRNAGDGTTVGPAEVAGRPVNPLVGWCLTGPYNFIGAPAASVPVGRTGNGLPVGLQLAGRRFHDHTVMAAAAAVESVRPRRHLYAGLDEVARDRLVAAAPGSAR